MNPSHRKSTRSLPACLWAGCVALGLLVSGCVTHIAPPVMSDTNRTQVSKEKAYTSWAQVLRSHVDDKGRVDFKAIADNPTHLYRYVVYVSETSPEAFPQRFPRLEDRLQYHLNAYNALALYGVITHNFPEDFHRFSDRAKFFKFTEYTIGGEKRSLYDYENKVIRPLGDPRVHFALNCMVRACPRLPRTPFQAKSLNADLDALTKEFVNHPRHVEVLPAEGVVRLSEIFKFYEEDFVGAEKSPSLIAYINRYRQEPIDENFKVEFMDYDWTVNAQ